MRITVKMITKVHPRGCVRELELPEGTTVGGTMDHLLQTDELRPYGPELFFEHVCMHRGLIVPRDTVLNDGDYITIAKVLSGG